MERAQRTTVQRESPRYHNLKQVKSESTLAKLPTVTKPENHDQIPRGDIGTVREPAG